MNQPPSTSSNSPTTCVRLQTCSVTLSVRDPDPSDQHVYSIVSYNANGGTFSSTLPISLTGLSSSAKNISTFIATSSQVSSYTVSYVAPYNAVGNSWGTFNFIAIDLAGKTQK